MKTIEEILKNYEEEWENLQNLDCMVADINEYSCIKFERILPCSSEEM